MYKRQHWNDVAPYSEKKAFSGMLCCLFGVNIQINLYIVSMIQLAYAKKLFQKNQ